MKVSDLSENMARQLPDELTRVMQLAGQLAQRRGQRLYLVGGVVRDVLLGRTNLDLDLVVEGDAIALARELASSWGVKIVTHPHFGTAKLHWGNWSVDLATARSETYSRPGALPTVRPGSIEDDLYRRDFTINAMAVELNPGRYGRLLDPHGGRADLADRLIRVLHDRSFIDDATRIWRGLRYEQRLNFRLEPATLKLVKRDVDRLDAISGDRIRHELELVFEEELPEKTLRRADELGVLARLHPSLKGDGWLAGKFEQARRLSAPDLPPVGLYLALLAYRLSSDQAEQLISYLRLPKVTAQAVRAALALKEELGLLAVPDLKPSGIYAILHGYSITAITANWLAADSPLVRERIRLFVNKLRYVRPALSGEDLKRLGVAEGPRIREILNRLRDARLDGEVKNKQDEERMVRGWSGEGNR